MKYYILFFFVLFTNFLSAQDDWKHWSSFEGNFKVFVPAEMEEQVQTITTEIGDLEYHRFFYQSVGEDVENFVYMVNYVDYPEGSLHSDSTDLVHSIFEATKEEAILNVEGELQYADAIEIHDFPGQIWRIDYNKGHAILKTKVFVVNNRFYLLQVATTKTKRMNRSINKFLNSFILLNPY